MSDMVQMALKDIAKSALGVMVANAVNFPERVDLGDSFALKHASNGVINFAISDLVNYFDGVGSKALNGDIYGILDDSLFFGGVTAGVQAVNLHETVGGVLQNNLNLSSDMTELAVQASVLSASRFAGRYIDENATSDALRIFRHPTLLMRR